MFLSKKAPKLVYTENKNWLNSKPLPWESLRGKVVLLDFWTYSCINCLRTLPALKEMWQKYKGKSFIIIGVHTPEFEFEKDLMNVQKAVRKLRIEYPVLNDPERINWENYGNNYWPRAALINDEGELIMDHIGESGYDEIETELVKELRKKKEFVPEGRLNEEKRYYHPSISPEIYAGKARNEGLGSSKVCSKNGCEEYYDSRKYHQNVIYLQGDWKQEREYLELRGEQGYIALQYHAREVNVVLEGTGSVTILVDEQPLTSLTAGKDVEVKYGKSLVFLHGPDMYNLVQKKEFHSGTIKLIPAKGVRVYAYTFG